MATLTFYTYLWLREDGTPYYAGKGSGDRCVRVHRRGKRMSLRPPSDPSRTITQQWPNEADAFVAEEFLIDFYGRADLGTGRLRNLTNGGEGASGKPPLSDEARKRIAEAKRHNPTRLGAVLSTATKLKISLALTGKKRSAESVEKQISQRRGIPLSVQHRASISAGNKGREFSDVTKAKIGLASVGRLSRSKTGQFVAKEPECCQP